MISHDEQVDRQFGTVAAAYLTSAVHSQGADLVQAAERLRGSRLVLDVGCGAGHLSFAVAPGVGRVIASDLSPRMLAVVEAEAARRGLRNLETRQASASALPFEDGHFDAVCTRFSAHHWTDFEHGLAEIRRVLAPGGKLLVIDIVAPENALCDTHLQAVELLRDPSHVRDRSILEWKQALRAAGFEPGEHLDWPLRMEFASWVERMKTPPDRVAVLRGLLLNAPQEVREQLHVGEDASFDLQSALIESR